MRSKLSIIIDTTVLFIVISLIVFAWVRFYTREVLISALAGVTISGLVSYLIVFLSKKRANKIILNKLEKDQATALLLNLRFTPSDKITDFLATVLKKSHPVEVCADFLILDANSAQNQPHSTLHSTEKMLFAPYFTRKIDMPYFIYVYKCAITLNIKHIAFVGAEFDSEVTNFAKQINGYTFEFIDFYKFYDEFIKNSGVQLPVVIDVTKPKMQWIELVRYAFSPARTRHYLLFGLLIILMSFLVPFKIYYLVLGSILCSIALIVRVIPLLKKQN